MNKKYNMDFVSSYFRENNCTLLSEEYIKTKIKLRYICSCGNDKAETSFENFLRGVRCIPCGIRKGSSNHKHKIEEVKLIFKENGCELLSTDFITARGSLEYICSCGKQSIITLDNFKRGKRCKDCGIKKNSNNQRLKYKNVYDIFHNGGCTLTSKEYKGYHSKLRYICNCGNENEITLADFKIGKRCWDCGRQKLREKLTLDYQYIESFFIESKCTLLSKSYKNAHQKLKYICECGIKSEISFDKFRLGQRCDNCGNKKISIRKKGVPRYDLRGENSPSWNFNITDGERVIKRNYLDYRTWRDSVFKRDNYTCQCCGKRGNGKLVAHHLDGYNWCKDKRIDINNGITLCKDCHNDFHFHYGWKNNTVGQWSEFLSDFLKTYAVK
jgi:hypothetical protein